MINVLIVDDSVVVRRLLSDALTSDPRISVAGSAANGAIALQKMAQLTVDVVLLDVEMPDMDGIETVSRLRKDWPELPVIMCSALTERGAEITLRALSAGATDYIAKPTAQVVQADGLSSFKSELVTKVVALAERARRVAAPRTPTLLPGPALNPKPSPRSSALPIAALAIGCSTGGPNALATLFEGIPRDLPVPVFIVQHMPPLFTKILADRLASSSGVSVVEAQHGAVVEPGSVYIAPGNYHLTVGLEGAKLVTLLNQVLPENSCRPAVDVLFRSLAAFYQGAVLACVLTGMGRDGALGARDVVAAGGSVIVQSSDTCVVPSMPRAVVDAGLAELILPLGQLAEELVRRVQRSTSFRAPPRALSQREI
jgi:two-component system chemotaxis response regulator CheB